MLKGSLVLGLMSVDKVACSFKLKEGDLIVIGVRFHAWEIKEFEVDKTMLLVSYCNGDIDYQNGM